MFERFTDRARQVVVLAQEEARALGHSYIGTEHILLGLLRVSDGVAARALESLGISLDAAREEVRQIVGEGDKSQLPSHIPFTPQAKKVLELSLREALQLGHNYIGTEHILLGLVRDNEAVAAQVLVNLGANLNRVRAEVMQFVRAGEAEPEMYLAGESAAPVAEQASSPPRTTRVTAAAHPAQPLRVAGSRIQLESLNARLAEVITRLEEIADRLATIEGHLAAGRPAARAPRKPPARKPKPPAAQPPGAGGPAAGGEAEQG